MPTPVMTPLYGDPIWGGLSFGASKSRFVFLVDSLIAGVRKTQEDVLKVFISIKCSMQSDKDMGGIDSQQRQNTTYIYISPSGD